MTSTCRYRSRQARSRGVTLVELIISMGIVSFVVMVTVVLLIQLNKKKLQIDDRMDSESGLLRAEWILRTYLSQAVNMYGTGNTSLDGYGGPTGRIRLFNGISSTLTPAINTVAVFNREAGNRGMGGSAIRSTGIFFHKPTATSSGVVFVDAGANPAAISPDYSDLFIENVVEFETRNFTYHQNDPSRPLLSAEIRIVVRYFTTENTSKSWCPKADIAANVCTQPTNYKDDERIFRVFFRNNDLNTTARGGNLREFAQGFLYFFGPKTSK